MKGNGVKKTLPSDEKAKMILDAVEDRKAVDPVLLDLRGKSLLADFFLVCSGTSNVHIRAIADRVIERVKEERLAAPRIEGQGVGEWVLLDFGDIVLHIMGEEPRERYKLEQFWSTPQPKGALPPTPGTADETDEDADEAFFDDADQEIDPVDELDDDDDLEEDADDEDEMLSLEALREAEEAEGDDEEEEDEDGDLPRTRSQGGGR